MIISKSQDQIEKIDQIDQIENIKEINNTKIIFNEDQNYECKCCFDKYLIKTMNKCSGFCIKFTHLFCDDCI